MTDWVTPRTWTDEELIDEDMMNTVRDNLLHLEERFENTVAYKGVLVIHEGNLVTI